MKSPLQGALNFITKLAVFPQTYGIFPQTLWRDTILRSITSSMCAIKSSSIWGGILSMPVRPACFAAEWRDGFENNAVRLPPDFHMPVFAGNKVSADKKMLLPKVPSTLFIPRNNLRRDDRVADCAWLEIRWARKGSGGSNPSLSV